MKELESLKEEIKILTKEVDNLKEVISSLSIASSPPNSVTLEKPPISKSTSFSLTPLNKANIPPPNLDVIPQLDGLQQEVVHTLPQFPSIPLSNLLSVKLPRQFSRTVKNMKSTMHCSSVVTIVESAMQHNYKQTSMCFKSTQMKYMPETLFLRKRNFFLISRNQRSCNFINVILYIR